MAASRPHSQRFIPATLIYEDVLKLVSLRLVLMTPILQVGDFGWWQLRTVLLLWVPMFMCGAQVKATASIGVILLSLKFMTTNTMMEEPKVLYCGGYQDCPDYTYNNSNLEIIRRDKSIPRFPNPL